MYTHFSKRVSTSSSTVRQLDLAFAALNPHRVRSGAVSRAELLDALRRMSSAPLDEKRLAAILSELEDCHSTISPDSFSAWMARRYVSSLEVRSLNADSMDRVPNYGDLWPN